MINLYKIKTETLRAAYVRFEYDFRNSKPKGLIFFFFVFSKIFCRKIQRYYWAAGRIIFRRMRNERKKNKQIRLSTIIIIQYTE